MTTQYEYLSIEIAREKYWLITDDHGGEWTEHLYTDQAADSSERAVSRLKRRLGIVDPVPESKASTSDPVLSAEMEYRRQIRFSRTEMVTDESGSKPMPFVIVRFPGNTSEAIQANSEYEQPVLDVVAERVAEYLEAQQPQASVDAEAPAQPGFTASQKDSYWVYFHDAPGDLATELPTRMSVEQNGFPTRQMTELLNALGSHGWRVISVNEDTGVYSGAHATREGFPVRARYLLERNES